MRAAAGTFGDAAAVAEPGGPVLSYRDLHDRVRDTARALIASGIEPGDRLAIWTPSTHHWVLAGLGALYAGAPLLPVTTPLTGPEALDVMSRSHARALLVADQFLGANRHALVAEAAARAGALLPGLVVRIPVEVDQRAASTGPWLGWGEFLGRAGQVPVAVADDRAAAVAPDDVSDILFTSGTTGRSKGAMSAHRQSVDVAGAWAVCAELTGDDRYLIVNPFFHSFGYKAGILACLLTGATIVPQLVFDPGQAMRLIEAMRITVFPGAPTIYTSILDHQERGRRDLSSLRLAVTGAAGVAASPGEGNRAPVDLCRAGPPHPGGQGRHREHLPARDPA